MNKKKTPKKYRLTHKPALGAKNFSVAMTAEIYEAIFQAAKKEGVSVSKFMRDAALAKAAGE